MIIFDNVEREKAKKLLLEGNRPINNKQYDVFDSFGNYYFPTDIKTIKPNVAYSSLEGYLYSSKK